MLNKMNENNSLIYLNPYHLLDGYIIVSFCE